MDEAAMWRSDLCLMQERYSEQRLRAEKAEAALDELKAEIQAMGDEAGCLEHDHAATLRRLVDTVAAADHDKDEEMLYERGRVRPAASHDGRDQRPQGGPAI